MTTAQQAAFFERSKQARKPQPQPEAMVIKPQPGPQEAFLSTTADIAIYGGAAGGGKTWSLLMEPLRHYQNGRFSAVMFRRTFPMIKNEGGLWDESGTIYPYLDAKPRENDLEWRFPSGMTVRFSHLQHEKDVDNWQGSQVPLFIFDELTHFTEKQFFYFLSRGRSSSGVDAYIRGACNPDASSWVKKFLAPWVDKHYPNPAKSGEIRRFVRDSGVFRWLNDGETHPDEKSVTFIAARVFDNKIMLKNNPGYLASLKALPPLEQARFLHGDWDAMPEAGKVLNSEWLEFVDLVDIPQARPMMLDKFGREVYSAIVHQEARFWDFAATEKEVKTSGTKTDPDYTAGVKMLRVGDIYVVTHLEHGQYSEAVVDDLCIATAHKDTNRVRVRWEIEGGSAGKRVSRMLATRLNGFDARGVRPQGDKLTRFKPLAQQAFHRNVKILRDSTWNDTLIQEWHNFPDWPHDDIVDAGSGAYWELTSPGRGDQVSRTRSPFDM